MVMATGKLVKTIFEQPHGTKYAYGIYPGGKAYNQTYAFFDYPSYNPARTSVTGIDAYSYDTSGNFSSINVTVDSFDEFLIRFKINNWASSNAGRMIRIQYTD